jgi:hypothetical protein
VINGKFSAISRQLSAFETDLPFPDTNELWREPQTQNPIAEG